jgi:mannonate dehydratase
MRWFGSDDTVRLQDIAQIPVIRGIVGTIENLPGDVIWTLDRVSALKSQIEKYGFNLEVIESIPVPEAIKQGTNDRDALIRIYSESIRNLGRAGVRVLCYNFMPVFDWMRTDLSTRLADGSLVTSYDHQQILDYDLSRGLEDRVAWGRGFTGQELQEALVEYQDINEEGLFENLIYFLERVVPVAEQAGVLLALHPDDPPWSIFGLPRIVRDQTTLQRVLEAVDSPNNGLTFCTGSLGAAPENDLPAMVRHFADRINFVHLRNVRITEQKDFQEVAHTDDSAHVDLAAVVEALVDIDYTGPMRPDHGRMIWGETGRTGYGLYDRALATMYLYGLWQGIRQQKGLAGQQRVSGIS